MHNKPLHLLLLLVAFTGSFARAETDIPTALRKQGLYEVSTDEFIQRQNQHERDTRFVVRIDTDGNLFVTKGKPASYQRTPIRHTFGTIQYEGTNRGEWGGALTATLPTGERKVLIQDNIVDLQPVGDSLMVITGLAHLSISQGTVYRVNNPGVDPVIKRVTLLPEAPSRLVVDARNKNREKVFVLGRSRYLASLSRLGNEDMLQFPVSDGHWQSITSAVLQWPYLIIGTYTGLVTIKIEKWGKTRVQYYLPE